MMKTRAEVMPEIMTMKLESKIQQNQKRSIGTQGVILKVEETSLQQLRCSSCAQHADVTSRDVAL